MNATAAAVRMQEKKYQVVPIVCPRCGMEVARAINGSSSICNNCMIWAHARPDLMKKGD